MCIKPKTTPEGNTIACGKCGSCISVKKWDWVSRGMAETATAPWAGTVTLTYDESPQSRDGAKVFRYSDVRNFVRRLGLKMGKTPRFIIAGERGSKRKRCHWHMILWAGSPVWNIGGFADFRKQIAAGFLPSDGPLEPYRCDLKLREKIIWSEWPFGAVYFDNADQNSIEYTLKYSQKDRFNAVAARGQKHEAKVEVSSAAYFRMSKQPPIGADFIHQTKLRWVALNQVPPSGQITVPGLKGTWYPTGHMRELMLDALADVYHSSFDRWNKRPAGWAAMVANFERTEPGLKILDRLMYKVEYPELLQVIEGIKNDGAKEKTISQIWDQASRDAKHKHCWGCNPCRACIARQSDETRSASRHYAASAYESYLRRYPEKGSPSGGTRYYNADTFHAVTYGPNPYCRREIPAARRPGQTHPRSVSRGPGRLE